MPCRERPGGEAAEDRQIRAAWRAPQTADGSLRGQPHDRAPGADEACRGRGAELLHTAPGARRQRPGRREGAGGETATASGMSGSSRMAYCRPAALAVVVFTRSSSTIWRWLGCRSFQKADQALAEQHLHGRVLVESDLQELIGHVRRVAAAEMLAPLPGPTGRRLRNCGRRSCPFRSNMRSPTADRGRRTDGLITLFAHVCTCRRMLVAAIRPTDSSEAAVRLDSAAFSRARSDRPNVSARNQ